MHKWHSRRNCLLLLMLAVLSVGIHPVYEKRVFGQNAAPGDSVRAGGNGVSVNGWLRVRDGALQNQAGRPLQLKGMSSHGLQWFGEYTNARALQTIGAYGANLFRVAMYADSSQGGYNESSRAARRNKMAMYAAVENALSADLYVIVDWHLLKDENPLRLLDSAVPFFDEVSSRYAHEPGVIYEICNEPNGETTWEDITNYAQKVIPVIRKNSPHAVIVVGTPKYSTNLAAALEAPLPFSDIMYALHVYTEYVDLNFEQNLGRFFEKRLPVFVTEWGISSENDRDHFGIARQFIDFLERYGISWANWSLCNKDESYSAIKPGSPKLSGWTEEDLSPSGKLVFSSFSRRSRPAP